MERESTGSPIKELTEDEIEEFQQLTRVQSKREENDAIVIGLTAFTDAVNNGEFDRSMILDTFIRTMLKDEAAEKFFNRLPESSLFYGKQYGALADVMKFIWRCIDKRILVSSHSLERSIKLLEVRTRNNARLLEMYG